MLTFKAIHRHPIWNLILFAAIALTPAGCAHAPARTGASPPSANRADSSAAPDAAEVWTRNCGRCHNLRPPDEFSDDEWEVIVDHMRVRATLPADEARTILEFLKAAQ